MNAGSCQNTGPPGVLCFVGSTKGEAVGGCCAPVPEQRDEQLRSALGVSSFSCRVTDREGWREEPWMDIGVVAENGARKRLREDENHLFFRRVLISGQHPLECYAEQYNTPKEK